MSHQTRQAEQAVERLVQRGGGPQRVQPDDRLLATSSELRMAFPVADVRQRRQFLERLWTEPFAGWTVDGFDPDRYAFVR